MFLSRNKKNNVYPCKPEFYYIKMGFKGGKKYDVTNVEKDIKKHVIIVSIPIHVLRVSKIVKCTSLKF